MPQPKKAVPVQKVSEKPKKVTPLSPRTHLSTLLLAMCGGIVGLRHFYLGQRTAGWVRFGLFLGALLWVTVCLVLGKNLLSLVGCALLAILFLMAFVDVFTTYRTVTKDVDGAPLATSVHDKRWALFLLVGYIVGILTLLGLGACTYTNRDMLVGKFVAPQYMTTGATSGDQKARNRSIVIANYEKLKIGQSKSEASSILGVEPTTCTGSKLTTSEENCLYGSYAAGYVVLVTLTDGKISSLQKYEY